MVRGMIRLFAPSQRAKPKKTPEGKYAAVLARLGVTLVLDVGANVGQTGLRLRELGFRGRIVSFEPVQEAYEVLLETARYDPEWLIASRGAVGASVGVVSLHVAEATDLSSVLEPTPALLETLPSGRTLKTRRVSQTTVAEALSACGRDDDRILLKIDVQGGEDAVLDGVGDAWPRIAAVQLEMSLFPLYRGEKTIGHYVSRLEALGFEAWLLTECNFSRTLCRQLQVDGLFARPAAG